MSEGISLVLPPQKEKQQQQQQQQQLGLPFQEHHHQQQQPFPLLFNSNSSNNNNKEKLLSSPVSTSTSAPTHQHYFPDFTTRMSIYPLPQHHHHHLPTATTTTTAATGNWNPTIVAATHHHHHHINHDHDASDADEEDPEEDEDEDDDVDDDDDEDDNDNDDHDHHIPAHDTTNDDDCNNSNKSTAISTMDKMGNGNGKPNFGNIMGPIGEVIMVKEGSATGCGQMVTPNSNNNNAGGMVTIAETNRDLCYSRYLHHTTEGSGGEGAQGRDMVSLNSSIFSARKEKEVPTFVTGSGDSLRLILSDPVTGALMDDAVILPCGHSFGGGGIQHVIKMKVCYTCSRSISEDSISPNLSLQAAVQAFRREEESRRSFKRRRERSDQDRGTNGDLNVMDSPRGRGVQFPFALADKVIIKGNKRTPQRFIGREAVVTTQCLNGWYVVKTLDNAESVKLQYRSLAKVSDESSSMAMSSKVAPNWLS